MILRKHYNGYLLIIPHTEFPSILDYLPWTNYMITRLRTDRPTDQPDVEATSKSKVLHHFRTLEAILRVGRNGGTQGVVAKSIHAHLAASIREKQIIATNTTSALVVAFAPGVASLFQTVLPRLNLPNLSTTLDRRLPDRLGNVATKPWSAPFIELVSLLQRGENSPNFRWTDTTRQLIQTAAMNPNIAVMFRPNIEMAPFLASVEPLLNLLAGGRRVSRKWLGNFLKIKTYEN